MRESCVRLLSRARVCCCGERQEEWRGPVAARTLPLAPLEGWAGVLAEKRVRHPAALGEGPANRGRPELCGRLPPAGASRLQTLPSQAASKSRQEQARAMRCSGGPVEGSCVYVSEGHTARSSRRAARRRRRWRRRTGRPPNRNAGVKRRGELNPHAAARSFVGRVVPPGPEQVVGDKAVAPGVREPGAASARGSVFGGGAVGEEGRDPRAAPCNPLRLGTPPLVHLALEAVDLLDEATDHLARLVRAHAPAAGSGARLGFAAAGLAVRRSGERADAPHQRVEV